MMQRAEIVCVSLSIVCTMFGWAEAAEGGLQDGLVAYYPFQGNAESRGGPAPDGYVSGATLASDRFGAANSAYAFDGVDDYIEIPNTNGVFNLTASWTLACWAKPFSPATDARDDPLIWKIARVESGAYTGNEDTFLLSWGYNWQEGQSGNVFYTGLERAADDEDFGVSSLSHEPALWHHVVGSYDGTSLRIYVDGELDQTANIGPIVAYTGPAPLRIGNIQHSTHIVGPTHVGAFDGVIDDVRIYDRALSDAEVADLHLLPEPATLTLLVLGGLALMRRRRR